MEERRKRWEWKRMGILGNFHCVFYCGKSVELIKPEKIVDFKVRISATHQVTELRWLRKPMVVPKPTGNGIQWTRNLWALASGITDNFCYFQPFSME